MKLSVIELIKIKSALKYCEFDGLDEIVEKIDNFIDNCGTAFDFILIEEPFEE